MNTYQVLGLIAIVLAVLGGLLLLLSAILGIVFRLPSALKLLFPKEARDRLKVLAENRRAEKVEAKAQKERLQRSIRESKLEATLAKNRTALLNGTAFVQNSHGDEPENRIRNSLLVDVPAFPALPPEFAISYEKRSLKSTKVVRNA